MWLTGWAEAAVWKANCIDCWTLLLRKIKNKQADNCSHRLGSSIQSSRDYLPHRNSESWQGSVCDRQTYFHDKVYPEFVKDLTFRFNLLISITLEILHLLQNTKREPCNSGRKLSWSTWLLKYCSIVFSDPTSVDLNNSFCVQSQFPYITFIWGKIKVKNT